MCSSDLEAKGVVGFLECSAGHRESGREVAAHACALGTLTRKEESSLTHVVFRELSGLVKRLDWLAHIRFRGWIRPAEGKLPFQLLVNARRGELGRHPDTVKDGAVIG